MSFPPKDHKPIPRFSIPLLILFFIIGFNPGHVKAAPSITNAQGVVSDGSSIIVNGSGFGATGPSIEILDDFEKGANSNQISTAAGSAQVNQWDYVGNIITYSTDYAHSGSKSMKIDWISPDDQWGRAGVNPPSATEIFFSWWQFLPSNRDVPGTNNAVGVNWKTYWLFGPTFPQSDWETVILSNSLPSAYTQLTGDDEGTPYLWGRNLANEFSDNFRKGVWMRTDVYILGGMGTGKLEYHQTSANTSGRQQIFNLSNANTQRAGQPWQNLNWPGFGRHDTNSQTYYDDIYVATGPGAKARIEIGNQATYAGSTNLAIATVTSWSDTQIVATIRQGSFAPGQTAYLYVVDANGNVNSPGLNVTIGSSALRPSPPTNLRILP